MMETGKTMREWKAFHPRYRGRVKGLFIPVALGILVLFFAKIALGYIRSLPLLLPDEGDILIPAFFHLEQGIGYPFKKYPPFPFMFYEAFLWVFEWFITLKESNLFLAGRLINLGLCCADIVLLFMAARDWMEDRWALLASFLFAFCPLILLSSAIAKSESLLLGEILIALWAGFRVMNHPESVGYHVICALAAAAAVATKFNPMPGVIWLACASMGLASSGFRFRRVLWNLAFGPGARWFAPIFFVAVFFLFLPVAGELKDFSWEEFRKDCYFLSAPSGFRATEEFLGFPYGRIAFPFTFLLPFALGPLNYLFILGAMALRASPPRWVAAWVISFAVYLALFTITTVPLAFNFLIPIAPMASVAPVFMLKRIKKHLGRGIAFAILILMSVSLNQSATLIEMLANMQISMKSVPKNCMFLVSHCTTASQGWDPNAPGEGILRDHPQYLYYSDSYGLGFCKAGNEKECRFFKNLIGPDSPYRIKWIKRVRYPWKWLAVLVNPEASFTSYLLESKELPAGKEGGMIPP